MAREYFVHGFSSVEDKKLVHPTELPEGEFSPPALYVPLLKSGRYPQAGYIVHVLKIKGGEIIKCEPFPITDAGSNSGLFVLYHPEVSDRICLVARWRGGITKLPRYTGNLTHPDLDKPFRFLCFYRDEDEEELFNKHGLLVVGLPHDKYSQRG